MSTLNLSGKNLATLPKDLWDKTHLQILNISLNNLKTLSENIGQLVTLQEIDASLNGLESLPDTIGNLTQLQKLNLAANALKKLPENIKNLKQLKIFNLSNNELQVLPTNFGQLQALETLDLRNNQFKNIENISDLFNIKELHLSFNQIQTLPQTIGQLTYLEKLFLSGNTLKTLPRSLLNLKNLQHLDLRDNLLNIPPEILQHHDDAQIILRYLEENYFIQETEALNEVKVVIVGQGNVGKTSLVNRLIYNAFDPDESTTEGIAIQKWPLEIKGQTIQLNIWDFGGQEILHATHQFFLTKRTLYILVYDLRSEEDNRLEYWLKIIQSFGGNAPIIIVGNKIDQNRMNLDQVFLQEKYTTIQGFYKVSCKENQGIQTVKHAIIENIEAMEHVFDSLNKNWMAVKQRLKNMSENYINYEQYQAICRENKIQDDKNQNILVSFLHDLGIILNFNDDPRLQYTHVLNPEWVTQGIYKIIRYDTDSKGKLKLTELDTILDNNLYPNTTKIFLIDLMEKFELCFKINNDTILIPEQLAKKSPKAKHWKNTLYFQYNYDFLPSSIISRFIVKMHNFIYQNTYWKTGVILKREEAYAEVKADLEEKKIYIKIQGEIAKKKDLLLIIREHFNSIHNSIKNLQAMEKVPLPDNPKISIAYNHLLKLEERGIKTYLPEGIDTEVIVKDLLNGIDPKQNISNINHEEIDINQLHDILQSLIDDTDTIIAIAELSKLNTNIIKPNSAYVSWLNIIKQAKKQNSIKKLLKEVQKIINNNEALNTIITTYYPD